MLATVKGDVHDIGKNLVDIILTNNGYEVHNLGIKVSITEMIEKALEVKADAIGMSGLLVKSTLIMRDNLEELNDRELSRHPGAARRRRAHALVRRARPARRVRGPAVLRQGRVRRPARDGPPRRGAARRRADDDPDWGRVPSESRVPARASVGLAETCDDADRSTLPAAIARGRGDNEIFVPPFTGARVVKGMPIDDIAGVSSTRPRCSATSGSSGPRSGEDDDEFKARIRPILREELAKAKADDLLQPAVVYGYFPASGDGNDVVIWEDESRDREVTRFAFPRQRKAPFLCIADFVRPIEASEVDYVAFHIVTMGPAVSEATAKLFADDRYQDYLHLHGLGVEMAEALAEYWHRRIREEWGFADEDGPSLAGLFRQQYRGGRYSWGYPACPDLEDNVKVLELLDGDRIGLDVLRGDRLPVPARADDVGDHPPPPQGQVLRRPLRRSSRRTSSGSHRRCARESGK